MGQPETIRLSPVGLPGERAAAAMERGTGELTQQLIDTDKWTDELVAAAGIPVRDVPFVSVGGGIGSFVTVDYLRIAGVPASQMKVLTGLQAPWQTYEYLTRVSQIPRGERLRSDSASRPDCIWGFPSYALAEALSAPTLKEKIAPLKQVLLEPVFDDFYTPRAGQVFTGLEREAKRIDYFDMVEHGQVRMVRRRENGGYFTILTVEGADGKPTRVAYRSTYVHLAVGYPGLKFLPDLQEYRTTHQDFSRVVNAYEPHEQVYESLQQRPGTVLIRGGGIVASRVLQRIFDDRERHGAQTQVIHLFRTFVDGSHGPSIFMRRRGSDGWAYQGFNYPKSVWGGQLKRRMRRLEGEERAKLYKTIGGTNTPYRRSWQRQMRDGRAGGYYKTIVGKVEQVFPGKDGGVTTRVMTKDGILEINADYIIDGTGLEADIAEHRVLADLLEHGGAGRNPIGRLDVEPDFEVRGAASGDGVMYASGTATLGGYFPGVDTFLGLQIAAQEIADDLARRKFCKRIGPVRSTIQWAKWARNQRI